MPGWEVSDPKDIWEDMQPGTQSISQPFQGPLRPPPKPPDQEDSAVLYYSPFKILYARDENRCMCQKEPLKAHSV